MSFDRRDIRKAMDVYTADNAYLGTVLAVHAGPAHAAATAAPHALQTSKVSGELLGPMPTQPLGNRAAQLQTAATRYATAPDAEALGDGLLVVGKWYGLLGRRTIPLDDVQTVSLERVVLRHKSVKLGNGRFETGLNVKHERSANNANKRKWGRCSGSIRED